MSFKARTAIVTGGSRGIGRRIGELLLESGCRVLVTGTGEGAPKGLAKGLRYLPLDLLRDESVEGFLASVGALGPIDILVNNAGINIIEPLSDIRRESWDKIMQVNLTGPMLITRRVSQVMKKAGYGRILNISSVFGVVSKERRSSYSASKAGLLGLTRAAALDMARHGILVNALCPGFTRTDLTASILSKKDMAALSMDIPLGRFASVDEIAEAALFLCSDKNTYLTGQAIVVDGGYSIR